MPSTADIKKAASRREARKAQREANVEKAHAQEAGLSDRIAEEKANPKPAAPAAPKKTRREQIAEKRAAAEARADAQERVVAPRIDPAPFLGQRETPPLHVLNALAKQADAAVRNEARDIAQAAGKAAFEAATGVRVDRSIAKRYSRVRDAQSAMEKARKEAKTE